MVDFDLTEAQLGLQAMGREFVQREVAPRVVGYNREGMLPWDRWRRLPTSGWWAE